MYLHPGNLRTTPNQKFRIKRRRERTNTDTGVGIPVRTAEFGFALTVRDEALNPAERDESTGPGCSGDERPSKRNPSLPERDDSKLACRRDILEYPIQVSTLYVTYSE